MKKSNQNDYEREVVAQIREDYENRKNARKSLKISLTFGSGNVKIVEPH